MAIVNSLSVMFSDWIGVVSYIGLCRCSVTRTVKFPRFFFETRSGKRCLILVIYKFSETRCNKKTKMAIRILNCTDKLWFATVAVTELNKIMKERNPPYMPVLWCQPNN